MGYIATVFTIVAYAIAKAIFYAIKATIYPL